MRRMMGKLGMEQKALYVEMGIGQRPKTLREYVRLLTIDCCSLR
jgi:hypothetical protein